MKSRFGRLWTVWVTSLGDWSQSIAWHLTQAVVKHRSASSIINFHPRANAKRTYFSFCLLLPFQLSGTAGVKNESAALKKGCAMVSFLKLTSFVLSPVLRSGIVTCASCCHFDKGRHSPTSKGNSNFKMASGNRFASCKRELLYPKDCKLLWDTE